MAQVNYVSAMGNCGKCGANKVSIDQDQKCLKCDAEPMNLGKVSNVQDPGDAKLREVLALSGVALKNTGSQSIKAPSVSAQIDTNNTQLLTVSVDVLNCLAGHDIEVLLTPEQLELVQSYLLGLETPKDMREARKLIKLIDRIDQLLGRS